MGDYGVRKYDDDNGRFTSIDPLWEKYRSLSPYHYSENNPLKIIDPSGMVGKETGENAEDKRAATMTAGFFNILGAIGGIVGATALMLAPTGVSQVAGVALYAASFTTLGLGIATMAEGYISESENRAPADIPGSAGEAFGNAIDKTAGGNGKLGGTIGGLTETVVTGLISGFTGGYLPKMESELNFITGVWSVTNDGISVVGNTTKLIQGNKEDNKNRNDSKKKTVNNPGKPGLTVPRMMEQPN